MCPKGKDMQKTSYRLLLKSLCLPIYRFGPLHFSNMHAGGTKTAAASSRNSYGTKTLSKGFLLGRPTCESPGRFIYAFLKNYIHKCGIFPARKSTTGITGAAGQDISTSMMQRPAKRCYSKNGQVSGTERYMPCTINQYPKGNKSSVLSFPIGLLLTSPVPACCGSRPVHSIEAPGMLSIAALAPDCRKYWPAWNKKYMFPCPTAAEPESINETMRNTIYRTLKNYAPVKPVL
jgi:hypothetical protein